MKHFRFRLESLATLRSWEEERARSAFQQALRNEQRVMAQLEDVEARRNADAAACMGVPGGSIDADARVRQWGNLLALERDHAAAVQKLAASRRIREQKMKSLIDAHRRVWMIEALRQRQQQAHRLAALRQEERELGDIIHARRASGGFVQ